MTTRRRHRPRGYRRSNRLAIDVRVADPVRVRHTERRPVSVADHLALAKPIAPGTARADDARPRGILPDAQRR
jgi:hypothetical protein